MIISVASGKGGTGKTTVATNLALSVGFQVQFLDCDVEEPNAHLFIHPDFEKNQTITTPVPKVDEDKCNKQDAKTQHKRDNSCLIKLCGHDLDPIPKKNIWEDNLIIWKTNILTEVINEFGKELWNEAESSSREEHLLANGVKQKHPLIVSATLEKLWNQERIRK